MITNMMTSSTIGMVVPAFKEKFGDGKKIDVVGTTSHDFISSTIDSVKPSGLSIDRRGNVRLDMNFGAQILVEEKRSWKEAWNMFFTVTMKGKVTVNSTNPLNKTVTVAPRSVEFSMLKFYDGDEEKSMESMLAQSLLNVQLDQLRKTFKPQKFMMNKWNNPKEMQCIGFNLTDIDIAFSKNAMQFNAGYTEILDYDKTFCSGIEEQIRKGSTEGLKKNLGLGDDSKVGQAFNTMMDAGMGELEKDKKKADATPS